MTSVLPPEFNYSQPHPVLSDEVENILVTLNPINGSTFGPSSQIIFDFLTGSGSGFIDPKSLYIRYKYTATTGVGAQMLGVPVYTPFFRCETMVNGSQTLETMNQYNQTMNDLITFSMNHADRFGKAPQFGFTGSSTGLTTNNIFGSMLITAQVLRADQTAANNTISILQNAGSALIQVGQIISAPGLPYGTTVTAITAVAGPPASYTITMSNNSNAIITANTDIEFYSPTTGSSLQNTFGRTLGANETGFFSAPLPCYISNCEQPVPAFLVPFRLQFTLDSIANMFTTVVVPTNFVLSNVELCYNKITMPSLENAIRRIPHPIQIKTQSFYNVLAPIGAGVAGNACLIYNTRFLSAKAIFARISGGANTANQVYDAIDITSGNGDYSLNIGGKTYPQRPLSTTNNKAGIMTELMRAVSNVFANNSCAIDIAEWSQTDASGTTFQVPGKFYIGFNLQRYNYTSAIFTGISSTSSPISFYINLNTPTTQAHSVNLIFNYNCVLTIDPQTLQVTDVH